MQKPCRLLALFALVTIPLAPVQAAPKLTVLYAFGTAQGDGTAPQSSLLADAKGNLYGTTYYGGANNAGTVFELSPPANGSTSWTERVLYSFNSKNTAGEGPSGSLMKDAAGNLYGTTQQSGTAYYGTAFKLSPPAKGDTAWTHTKLWTFGPPPDGIIPEANLIADAAGNLYGTTTYGGDNGLGTVFRLTPPAQGQTAWTEKILFSFGASGVGMLPQSGLLLDAAGNLYGTAAKGGTFGAGTVFRLTPPANGQGSWIETTLFSFNFKDKDGAYPQASLLADTAGNLYGTTTAGSPSSCGDYCGTVFELSPPPPGQIAWTQTVLAGFLTTTTRSTLIGGKNGNLYGTTYPSSNEPGDGSVFALGPPAQGETAWTKTVIFKLKETGVYNQPSSLIEDRAGNLYGTTSAGGIGYGTVFKVSR
jgi:uncharacterized repeat protein (TIGR03803 family)